MMGQLPTHLKYLFTLVTEFGLFKSMSKTIFFHFVCSKRLVPTQQSIVSDIYITPPDGLLAHLLGFEPRLNILEGCCTSNYAIDVHYYWREVCDLNT